MSYQHMGGDLKAHVGHKVEITGTMDRAKMKKDESKTTGTTGTSSMDSDKMDSEKMKSSMLKVKSVKMRADTCQ